MKISGEFFCCI